MAEAKKTHKKSPVYPSIGLKNAITKVKMLYDKEKRNSVPKKRAAEAMGYKSISITGSALQLLSSLYQYGLIVRKKGEVKLSDDAFTILNAPEDSPDKTEALTNCGSKPKVFSDIYAKYPDELPSDATLIWFLQQQNYSKNAAETIIQCYKETIEIANLREKELKSNVQENADVQKITNAQSDTLHIISSSQDTNFPSPKPVVLMFPFGEKSASITITGGKPSQDEMTLLISILEAFKKTLPVKKEE